MTHDQRGNFAPGDIYEDCSFHPILCTYIDDVITARAYWPAYLTRRKAEFEAEQNA